VQPAAALYLIGAIALTLLFVGIHNAGSGGMDDRGTPSGAGEAGQCKPASGTADVDAPQPPSAVERSRATHPAMSPLASSYNTRTSVSKYGLSSIASRNTRSGACSRD